MPPAHGLRPRDPCFEEFQTIPGGARHVGFLAAAEGW
jgi:hypothetical protein